MRMKYWNIMKCSANRKSGQKMTTSSLVVKCTTVINEKKEDNLKKEKAAEFEKNSLKIKYCRSPQTKRGKETYAELLKDIVMRK